MSTETRLLHISTFVCSSFPFLVLMVNRSVENAAQPQAMWAVLLRCFACGSAELNNILITKACSFPSVTEADNQFIAILLLALSSARIVFQYHIP